MIITHRKRRPSCPPKFDKTSETAINRMMRINIGALMLSPVDQSPCVKTDGLATLSTPKQFKDSKSRNDASPIVKESFDEAWQHHHSMVETPDEKVMRLKQVEVKRKRNNISALTEIPFPSNVLPPPKIRGLIPAQKPKRAKPQPYSVKLKGVDRGSQADLSPIPPTDFKQQNECIKIIQSFASQCLSKIPQTPDQHVETLTSANDRPEK